MKVYCSTYDGFKKYIDGKRLVCYGAGKMLHEMEEEIPMLKEFYKEIEIVDGNVERWGTKCNLYGAEITIQSPQLVLNNLSKESVLLVTSGYLEEILSSLESILEEEREVFAFPMIRGYDRDNRFITIGEDLEITPQKDEQQIPKIIHYCWFSGEELPMEFQRNLESWKKYCPDYEFKEWNATNCDFSKYRYAEQAIQEKRWGFAGDVIRLDVVEKYGGVYLDLDVKLLKSLDELLYLDAYAAFEDNNWVNIGSGFGARPHHPIISQMLEYYKDVDFRNSDGSLNLEASPMHQTRVLKKHGLTCNGRMQNVGGMTILPMDCLCAKSVRTGLKYITQNTFSLHDFAASWLPDCTIRNKKYLEELFAKVEYK